MDHDFLYFSYGVLIDLVTNLAYRYCLSMSLHDLSIKLTLHIVHIDLSDLYGRLSDHFALGLIMYPYG